MKIILISDVKKQGKKGDILDVKDGYGKFLINNHQAVMYTNTSVGRLNDEKAKAKEEDLKNRELLSKLNDSPYPTMHWDDEISSVLLESDKIVPVKDRCTSLAEQLRLIFPKGIKVGNSAWRGNVREITLRLQKFFKLYGNEWTDDEIIDATRRYVEHFNGDYTYMRILKYFIIKFDTKQDEEGNSHREDVSELATWLENGSDMNDNEDWTSTLV